MRMKLVQLIFFILISSVYAKNLDEIKTISCLVDETSYYNNRKTEKEYQIKSILPDRIYKEIVSPEINKGEIYVYSGNEKFIYYPLLEQTISQKIDEDENFIIKVIKDLKKPKNLTILKEGNKIRSLKYETGVEIIFENHYKVGEYNFPKYAKIYDDGILISELKFSDVKLDISLDEKQFRLDKR